MSFVKKELEYIEFLPGDNADENGIQSIYSINFFDSSESRIVGYTNPCERGSDYTKRNENG